MTDSTESPHPSLFVNLPVQDLGRSIGFFERLGFRFDPRFTDDKAACMVLGDESHVMLLTRSFFSSFTDRPVLEPEEVVGALYALAFTSRRDVDRLATKAEAAGARLLPPKDMGFMYQRSFVDLDGYQWGPFSMDPSAFERSQGSSS